MPASFREALEGQSFRGIIAFRSLRSQAIEGMGIDRMEKLSVHMDSLDLFSQNQDDWAASIFADAQQLAFDSEGRISLGEELMAYAQLTDSVSFVGRGPTFQLWNPGLFAQHQEQARQRLAERATSLGALGVASAGLKI